MVYVIIVIGQSGSGKSKSIRDNTEASDVHTATSTWGIILKHGKQKKQTVLVIEDFDGWMPVCDLLNLLRGKCPDYYGCWQTIYILTRVEPEMWYTWNSEDMETFQSIERMGSIEMLRRRQFTLIPPPIGATKLLTIVFDLDETLVSNRANGVVFRPFAVECLRRLTSMRALIDVILWTASTEEVANAVVGMLEAAAAAVGGEDCVLFDYVIFRSPAWWSSTSLCVKDVSLLGRPVDRILLIDNRYECMFPQPHSGLKVSDFSAFSEEAVNRIDATLANVYCIIQAMLYLLAHGWVGKDVGELMDTIGVPSSYIAHGWFMRMAIDQVKIHDVPKDAFLRLNVMGGATTAGGTTFLSGIRYATDDSRVNDFEFFVDRVTHRSL